MSSPRRNPFVRQGLPFIGLIVLGYAGLSKLLTGKNEIENLQKGRRSLTIREYDLEQDYKETMKKLGVDKGDYDIVRIPRAADETEE